MCRCVERVCCVLACLVGRTPRLPPRAVLQARAAKSEQEARRLQLRSLQYLERYVYLVLFNAYLHLEKEDSWRRPFSSWMREVRGAGSRWPERSFLSTGGFPDEVLSRSAVGVRSGVRTWPAAGQSGMSGQREREGVGSSTGQGVRLGPALGTPTPGLTFSGCFL